MRMKAAERLWTRNQASKQLRDSAPQAEQLYLHLLFVVRPASVTSPLYDVLGHTNHIFSESSWSKDIKIDITKCLILKYTNTNTQIKKYTNTAYYEVPGRPNMWYIFEKRIVQRYQK